MATNISKKNKPNRNLKLSKKKLVLNDKTIPYETLDKVYENITIENGNKREEELNDFYVLKENMERDTFNQNKNSFEYLYPTLDDQMFNIKISERKEFNDTKYDGKIHNDIENQSNILCNAEYELAPHQLFVRNFMSFQTPYNGLLLNHGF